MGSLKERGGLRWSEPICREDPPPNQDALGREAGGEGERGFLRPPRKTEGGLAAVARNMRTSRRLLMRLHFQQMRQNLLDPVIQAPADV